MKSAPSVWVMSITPFAQDGELDEAGLRLHLRRLSRAGVSVYVGSSASGEGFSLTDDELERLFSISAEELKGKVPVRAMGCEPRHAGDMVDLLRRAARHGLDGVHVPPPDMSRIGKPTLDELELYYATIIGASALPVAFSSADSYGYVLPVAFVECMVESFPNITGFTYAGNDIAFLARLIERLGERIDIHVGGPVHALTALSLGATGFMGVEGNFSPELVASVISAFAARNQPQLSEAFSKLIAFYAIHAPFSPHSVRSIKPLMGAFGLPGGPLRAPRLPVGGDDLARIVAATAALDLPGVALLPAAGG